MDYERFKEDFQDALKDVLAGRGADVEVESRRVEKMNDSYDAITVKPVDSAIGVNISIEKAYSEYEKGTDIAEIADHFADAVENGLRESPQFDLDSISDYEQMKSKLSMEVVSAERNADFLQNVLHVSPKEVRPDGLLLGYPVITSGSKAHRKSFERLLGDRYDELVKSVSLEKRVSGNTPKTFLWHTFSDGNVPVDNSLLFAESLKKAEVPFELHIFPNGNHGLGLGTKETDTKDGKHFEPEVYVWTELFKTWVEKNI